MIALYFEMPTIVNASPKTSIWSPTFLASASAVASPTTATLRSPAFGTRPSRSGILPHRKLVSGQPMVSTWRFFSLGANMNISPAARATPATLATRASVSAGRKPAKMSGASFCVTARSSPISSMPSRVESWMLRDSASSASAPPTASAMPRIDSAVRIGRRRRLRSARPVRFMGRPPCARSRPWVRRPPRRAGRPARSRRSAERPRPPARGRRRPRRRGCARSAGSAPRGARRG